MRALPLLLLLAGAAVSAQPDRLRLNQLGFYPDGPKRAVVVDSPGGRFAVRAAGGGTAVFEGDLGPAQTWGPSGETVRLADFSALTAPGTYEVVVEGVGVSHPVMVTATVHEELGRAALKAFYFQRASTALEAAHAGPWARAAGHPDDRVLVHASAATPGRPTHTVLTATRGWYDAGDYNKYVVNSGISVGTLLGLFEWEAGYLDGFEVGIPESGNGVPDVVEEAMWNVRWMMAMQDADGGVYHKLTSATFSGETMPDQDRSTRYVVQKGTAATLDVAAVFAQASRVVARYPAAYPGLADSLRSMAVAAWTWARAHPSVRYDQGALNAAFEPDILTGEYADWTFDDEFDWAATELFLTTRADSFLTAARPFDPVQPGLPQWPAVRMLGYYSALRDEAALPAATRDRVRSAVLAWADGLVARQGHSAYGVAMEADDFYWGSNSVAANQGVGLLIAYRLSGEPRYLDAATAQLDYLLGRNATGYAFVTGFGDRTPMDPHHRPSRSDRVAAPVPGLLVGGPHSGGQDVGGASWQCGDYRSSPAASYIDDWCSYATNEVAINWNAPLAYLALGVEAARSATGAPTSAAPDPVVGIALGISPNPSQGTAAARFRLAAAGEVTVRVFDGLGREVRRVLDGAPLGPGAHTVPLPTGALPAGVYSVRVETPTAGATGRLTVVR